MNHRHALQDFQLDQAQKHLFEDDEKDKINEVLRICNTYQEWTDAESAILEIKAVICEERLVRVCSECKTPVNEETYSCGNGWDGVTRCPGCGEVEGETEYIPANAL